MYVDRYTYSVLPRFPKSRLLLKNGYVTRGVYRTSSAKWFHPKDSIPQDSKLSSGGTVRSPLTATRDGFRAQLRFAANAAPLTLAFTVHDPQQQQQQKSGGTVGDCFVTSQCSRPFAVPVGMQRGDPQFLGATFNRHIGFTVVIYAPARVRMRPFKYDILCKTVGINATPCLEKATALIHIAIASTSNVNPSKCHPQCSHSIGMCSDICAASSTPRFGCQWYSLSKHRTKF